MKPRHDEPQVNRQPFKSGKKKSKRSPLDDMDEASKEAHIVHKIEMAIKKSKSERKDLSRSRSNPRTPAQHQRHWDDEGSDDIVDENYQMIKTDHHHHQHRSKPKRSTSVKVKRHKARPPLEPPRFDRNRHRKSLVDLDDPMDEVSDLGGVVDDKRGFQIDVDRGWISNTFSDPTLDTYENNHFMETDRGALGLIDPQRIQCGPAKSVANSSKESDRVTSIIDRIHEKKAHKSNTYPRKKAAGKAPKVATPAAIKKVPNELITFDNYEDDDGYYYEDEEDEYPMYLSSRPPPPRPAAKTDLTQTVPLSTNFPPLVPEMHNNSNSKDKSKHKSSSDAGLDSSLLQSQVDEINQLHRDIQRQQELIKQVSQLTALDEIAQRKPNESSAEVYHRELARQSQAELYRLELMQKSMLLEKQMEMYRRNQEEWNKVRDMAIKEEEERRKTAEKAREAWQAEMRERLADIADDDDQPVTRRSKTTARDLSAINEDSNEIESRDTSTEDSGILSVGEPSLYHKIAALNSRAEITDEDQKLIEAEILKELHMELSKQAAEKKLLQKPRFFSAKMQNSWSGKPVQVGNDPQKPVEEVTQELTKQIYELNLEMAPSKVSLFPRKSKDGKKGKGDEDDEDDYNSHTRSNRSDPIPSSSKKKKKLLRVLGLKKSKDRDLPLRGSAEINPPRPIARTLTDMVSPRSAKQKKSYDFEEPTSSVRMNEDAKVPESEPAPAPLSRVTSTQSSAQRCPHATSSQSTQLTSNRVYIGVDGDAIEAMSCSSRNMMSPNSKSQQEQITPALSKESSSKDLSCESRDRYTTCSDAELRTRGSKLRRSKSKPQKKNKAKKGTDADDPTIYEFLEVQYYPHDQLEAPLDEIEADAHRSSF